MANARKIEVEDNSRFGHGRLATGIVGRGSSIYLGLPVSELVELNF